jgi:hypothetical protein
MLIRPLIVGERLPAGGPPIPYPLNLGALQRSRRRQLSWMIPLVPAIEGLNSGGILVATDLVRAIKEP